MIIMIPLFDVCYAIVHNVNVYTHKWTFTLKNTCNVQKKKKKKKTTSQFKIYLLIFAPVLDASSTG